MLVVAGLNCLGLETKEMRADLLPPSPPILLGVGLKGGLT